MEDRDAAGPDDEAHEFFTRGHDGESLLYPPGSRQQGAHSEGDQGESSDELEDLKAAVHGPYDAAKPRAMGCSETPAGKPLAVQPGRGRLGQPVVQDLVPKGSR